jgi:hypothetical protein
MSTRRKPPSSTAGSGAAAAGIDPKALADRCCRRGISSPLSGRQLARWLTAEQLATVSDGLLYPTPLCVELASWSSRPVD